MKEQDDFNFDEWAALAQSDPAAFEAKRRAVIKARIDAIPDSQAHVRKKLTAVLLDKEHPADASPMERTVGAFNLMQESMVELVEAHGKLLKAVSQSDAPAAAPALPAAVRYTRLVSE